MKKPKLHTRTTAKRKKKKNRKKKKSKGNGLRSRPRASSSNLSLKPLTLGFCCCSVLVRSCCSFHALSKLHAHPHRMHTVVTQKQTLSFSSASACLFSISQAHLYVSTRTQRKRERGTSFDIHAYYNSHVQWRVRVSNAIVMAFESALLVCSGVAKARWVRERLAITTHTVPA